MALIIADNITKDYQTEDVVVHALQDVDFEIEPASFVSFVGPSGSGKTTILNLIGCLDKPSAGNLRIADTDVVRSGAERERRLPGQTSRLHLSGFQPDSRADGLRKYRISPDHGSERTAAGAQGTDFPAACGGGHDGSGAQVSRTRFRADRNSAWPLPGRW